MFLVITKARKNNFLPKKYFLHIWAILKENKIFWHFWQKTTNFGIFKGNSIQKGLFQEKISIRKKIFFFRIKTTFLFFLVYYWFCL